MRWFLKNHEGENSRFLNQNLLRRGIDNEQARNYRLTWVVPQLKPAVEFPNIVHEFMTETRKSFPLATTSCTCHIVDL